MSGRVLTLLQFMYAGDKVWVFTNEGPSNLLDCSTGVQQGSPLSSSLFSLYLDELGSLLEEASDEIDCPCLAEILIAVLLFADDVALFSYSKKGLQRLLDILQAFCFARGLKVKVQKIKTMVPEHQSSHTSPVLYAGNEIEKFQESNYQGTVLKCSRTLSPAIECFCKAATRAMFALQQQCQQLHLHNPRIRCKSSDTPGEANLVL